MIKAQGITRIQNRTRDVLNTTVIVVVVAELLIRKPLRSTLIPDGEGKKRWYFRGIAAEPLRLC